MIQAPQHEFHTPTPNGLESSDSETSSHGVNIRDNDTLGGDV